TGGGRSALSYHPWKETLPDRFDRLIAAGKAKECVLAVADCFTSFGGSQYLNSSATGRYEDHVLALSSFLTAKLGLLHASRGRARLGKSSGGYGALMLGMKNPGVFGHVASHSGDMLFDVSFAADLPKAARKLAKFGGEPARFVKEFLASRKKDEFDHDLVNVM